MNTKLTPALLRKRKERVFALIEAAALSGQRCPPTAGPDAHPDMRAGLLSELAREGRVRIEISGLNWRTVTITQGPHAGKHTRRDPSGRSIYQVIDKNGRRVNGVLIETIAEQAKRQQPWKPGDPYNNARAFK